MSHISKENVLLNYNFEEEIFSFKDKLPVHCFVD